MRCFIAIELEKDIINKIEDLKSEFNMDGIKLVEKENLHITVKFLGEIDDNTLEKIKMLDLPIEPIESRVGHVGVFPSEDYIRVIWIGASNLIELFKNIDRLLSELGFKEENEYIPHITIGRVKFLRNKNDKKLLKDKIKKYKNVELGTFKVKNIVLMKSLLTNQGPKYFTIKRW